MFENRVLRRIFGPKKDEVTGEFNDPYCSPTIKIEKNEMGGACSAYGEGRGVYRVWVGKPEGRRPLGRLRRRLEDNIKADLQEVESVWTGLRWLRIETDGGHF
jgi:hypothetical protein